MRSNERNNFFNWRIFFTERYQLYQVNYFFKRNFKNSTAEKLSKSFLIMGATIIIEIYVLLIFCFFYITGSNLGYFLAYLEKDLKSLIEH